MPLNGTLQDLSLPNLIQLQCGEQRPAEVRLLRRGREAILGFANGELIHARIGSRAGDIAIYELVAWDDAEFQVTYSVSPLEQNVFTPWSALVLEGMRRLDEARAEQNPAYEALAQQLAQQRGVRAAILFGRTNPANAAASDPKRQQDAEWIADIAERAQSVGDLLGFAAFDEMVSTLSEGKLWIESLDEAVVASWLDGRSTVEPLKAIVQSLKRNKTE